MQALIKEDNTFDEASYPVSQVSRRGLEGEKFDMRALLRRYGFVL